MSVAVVERSEVRYGTKVIPYSIRRSSRRKTVSIAIDPSEGVLVTAPTPAPVKRLDDIVHAKASWIVDRLKRTSDLPSRPSQREFVSEETFLYLGRQYRLRVQAGAEPVPVRLDRGWLTVSVPLNGPPKDRAGFVRGQLIGWYRGHAEGRLLEAAERWAQRLDVQAKKVVVVEAKMRWGSATASKVVRLNWRIIQAPSPLVEYVVAHELVHLRHPNHTRDFWAALGRVMPDYDKRKERLRVLGPQLEW
jgi:predicted metal-dependent hydrolase